MTMYVLGADENGLGPRLGPLIATAVLMETPSYEVESLSKFGISLGISDSKASSSFGRMSGAESLSLALVERISGVLPRSYDELLDALSLQGRGALTSPCPDEAVAQCWSAAISLPAFGGDPSRGHEALERLEERGVRLLRVRSGLACPGVLNRERDAGRNKLAMDLALFEGLILDARSSLDAPLLAICGMVGGMRRYAPRFREVEEKAVEILREVKGESRYRLEGVGEVSFEVKADARHLPVSLASMVGKYVRELSMERINRFYRGQLPGLRQASGYHDPVTARFVEESAPLRARLRIADDCFERRG